ncbi:zinc finger and SCAN domain-containing protein 30-like [Tiliqua scincoides]|uniref:zinc finger and SCAN domain-containing protein 30-like n=1 Tax=Tiliqua scincoides TaxID=71010 RepID=UPI003461B122
MSFSKKSPQIAVSKAVEVEPGAKAMKEETCEGPEAEEGSGGAGKAPDRDQPPSVMESQKGQEEPGREMQQRWEAQWQEFLKTLQAPHSTWEMHQLSEDTPWEDAKAFLASFEQVAAACRWPRGEWVARLLPALSGEAQQAFSLLAARDKEDYGKVKAAILRGDALRKEMQRQHFRQFCCQDLGDPRRMYRQLQELCCQWLKPEKHTKEEILEVLILEQFLASLPVDVQTWIQAGGPDSFAQAVALLEDFLVSRSEANPETWQETLQEWAVNPPVVKEEPLDMVQGESPEEPTVRFKDTQQNVDGEVAVPGIGIACPASLLPAEGQDMAEAELSKALGSHVGQVMIPEKMGAALHMVEQTPVQSNQWTTFWKVLQEDDENMDTTEDGKETHFKVKNSQVGGNEPVQTPRRGRGKTQEKTQENPRVLEPGSAHAEVMALRKAIRAKGGPSKAKRTRKVLSLSKKIEILDLLKSGMTASAVGRKIGKNESSIRAIKQKEAEIRANVRTDPTTAKRVSLVRDKVLVKTEKALRAWLEDMNQEFIPVDGAILREKALCLYEQYCEGVEKSERKQFKASKGWLASYVKRYNLKNLTLTGVSALADALATPRASRRVQESQRRERLPS